MSKKFSLYGVFAAIFALCLMVASPALAHHDPEHEQGGGSEQTASENASEDRGPGGSGGGSKGNGGSSETESDHDGDADSDSDTQYTEDNDTNDGRTPNNVEDDGDNEHPSGRDRSVEEGGSGNQGNAESDPDDDGRGPDRSNGGPDKPNGSGGVDEADQDGNNGCGNDDDFEDDNEGLCGGPDRTKPNTITKTCPDGSQMPANGKCDKVKGIVVITPGKPCDADATMPGIQECNTPPVVGPNVEVNPACPAGTVMDASGNCLEVNPATPAEVLGVRLSKAPAVAAAVQPAVAAQGGAVLPFTGGDVLVFLAAAFGLILAGLVATKIRRSES
ncbi:MAG: hypothetical protein M3N53_00535 [Actinomycetota bacterium]|nr:hypothetical protein [Actinomycetota bacterium]